MSDREQGHSEWAPISYDWVSPRRPLLGPMPELKDRCSTEDTSRMSTPDILTPDEECIFEVISSDKPHAGSPSVREDDEDMDLQTPRAPHGFVGSSQLMQSPPKARGLVKAVGKAKNVVKALMFKRTVRGHLDKKIVESDSATAMSSAIPGGWTDISGRPAMTIIVDKDTATVDGDRLQCSSRSTSGSSITGIYSPELPCTPPSTPAPTSFIPFPAFSRLLSSASVKEPQSSVAPESLVPQQVQSTYPAITIRIALFVPWCVAVGATILLFPNQVDLVWFSPGYISDPPPRDLRRFAFFAENATDYVKIFLLVLLGSARLSLEWCAIVVVLAVARFAYVWVPFTPRCCVNNHVGEDDMESLWLLVQDQAYIEDVLARYGPHDPEPVIEVTEATPVIPTLPSRDGPADWIRLSSSPEDEPDIMTI